MYEVQCFDQNGNTINYFTQWDINQTIVIPVDNYEFAPNSPEYTAPEVHFCNTKSTEALVVRSMVISKHTIEVKVPNELLQEPYPLFVFVYLSEDENPSQQSPQRVVLRSEIPIRKRVKPSDYSYVENITKITAKQIEEEIWYEVNKKMDAKFAPMQIEIDTFQEDVTKFLNSKSNEIKNEIDSIPDKIDYAVTEYFKEETAAINDALDGANKALENAEFMQNFIDQVNQEKEVYTIEDQTLKADNLATEGNLTVGYFVWITNSDKSMSLKWVGGEV